MGVPARFVCGGGVLIDHLGSETTGHIVTNARYLLYSVVAHHFIRKHAVMGQNRASTGPMPGTGPLSHVYWVTNACCLQRQSGVRPKERPLVGSSVGRKLNNVTA